MQIDEKMLQEGSQNDEHKIENHSPGVRKSRKMETGDASKRQQNAKLKKILVVFNSVAPFLSILVKNGGQDGGQNPLKINKKSIWVADLIPGRLGSALGPPKSCQKL